VLTGEDEANELESWLKGAEKAPVGELCTAFVYGLRRGFEMRAEER
jgi:hypothetical protein